MIVEVRGGSIRCRSKHLVDKFTELSMVAVNRNRQVAMDIAQEM
jgi:hypothetical protein